MSARVLFVTAKNFQAVSRFPRLLTLGGCRVDVMAPAGSVISRSNWIAELHAGASDPERALELLKAHLSSRAYDWVILGDDAVLTRAAERWREPWLAKSLPVLRPGDCELLISKSAFSRAMRRAGVLMAEARYPASPAEILPAAEDLGYPVIVKPDLGYSGVGLFAAKDRAELSTGLATAQGAYIVERFIPGRVGLSSTLFFDGKPVWWNSFLKEGVWPAPFGPSARRRPFEPRGVEEILGRIGAAVGARGFCGIDWMMGDDGKLYVIELNGRPVATILGDPRVQKDLPETIRGFLAGKPAVSRPPERFDTRLWHAMPGSFMLACEQKEWTLALRLLLGAGLRTDTPWDDLGLLGDHALRMAKIFARLATGRPLSGPWNR